MAGDGPGFCHQKAPHCAVYRVVLPGLDFHLKHYHPADARSRARSLLRVGKARVRSRAARAKSPRAACRRWSSLACRRVGGWLVLLTRTVPDAQTLTEFLETRIAAHSTPRDGRGFVNGWRSCSAGSWPGCTTPASSMTICTPAIYFSAWGRTTSRNCISSILYAVRLGRAAGLAAQPRQSGRPQPLVRAAICAIRPAALLGGVSGGRTARPGRVAAKQVVPSAADDPQSGKPYSAIEPSILARQGPPLSRRQSLVPPRPFRRRRLAPPSSDLDPAVLAPLLADPDEPFRRPGVIVLKDSPSSTVIEFDLPVGGVRRRVIYKRFAVTRWTDPWAALFRPAPALRSYVMGHGMRLRGLPTPRPLAVWHRTRLRPPP